MNILIILSGDGVRENNKSESIPLLKHAEHWIKSGSRLYLLSEKTANIDLAKKGFNLVKAEGPLPVKVKSHFWFFSGSHPQVDIVIENFSTINVKYYKTSTLLYIPNSWANHGQNNPTDKINKYLFAMLVKYIYKNNPFLVDSFMLKKMLIQYGVKEENIYILKKGQFESSLSSKSKNKAPGKSLITIVDNSDKELLLQVLSTFDIVERRDPEWIYKIVVNKEFLKDARRIISGSELKNKIHFFLNIPSSITAKEIAKAGLLLVNDKTPEYENYCLQAFSSFTPVIAVRNENLISDNHFEKNIVTVKSKESYDASQAILEYFRDRQKIKKTTTNAFQYALKYSWENVSEESRSFLEKIN